jgi:hypothetical protein
MVSSAALGVTVFVSVFSYSIAYSIGFPVKGKGVPYE